MEQHQKMQQHFHFSLILLQNTATSVREGGQLRGVIVVASITLWTAATCHFAVPHKLSLPQIQVTKINHGIKKSNVYAATASGYQMPSFILPLFFFFFLMMTYFIQWSYNHCMPFLRIGKRKILKKYQKYLAMSVLM